MVTFFKGLITCVHINNYNIPARGLTDVHAWLLRESVGVLVESQTHPCYIYVTLSIVMYSIAHKHSGIAMSQVRDCVARSHHIGLTSQKLRKRWEGQNTSDNVVNCLHWQNKINSSAEFNGHSSAIYRNMIPHSELKILAQL